MHIRTKADLGKKSYLFVKQTRSSFAHDGNGFTFLGHPDQGFLLTDLEVV